MRTALFLCSLLATDYCLLATADCLLLFPTRRQEAAAPVAAERDAGLPEPLAIPELTRDLLVRLVERLAVVGVGAAAHLRAAPRERLQEPVGVGERLAGGADDVSVAAPQHLF